jgi:single-strand DNA-binding protein
VLNQVILVGKLVSNPKLKKLKDSRSQTVIYLEIKRNTGNSIDGEADSNTIPCILWNGIAEQTVEHCKKGSTIGVKARLVDKEAMLENGELLIYTEVIAEKITFINAKSDE